MDELDDLKLDPADEKGTGDDGPAWDRGDPDEAAERPLESSAEQDKPYLDPRPRRPWLVAVVALLVAGAVGWWWMAREEPEAPAQPAPVAEAPDPAPAQPEPEVAEPPFEVPPLSASDEVVAALVRELSEHPNLVAWTVNEDLARRFVASVANVAEGVTPKPHLRFLDPGGSFEIRDETGAPAIDPRTYRRYDAAAEVFSSLDAEGSATLYRKLLPLFDEAWAELGMPGQTFDEVLTGAFRLLLGTPAVNDPVALSPRITSFEFADPALENLAPAQKQLLRMGPRNVARVKAKLRELAEAMELEL